MRVVTAPLWFVILRFLGFLLGIVFFLFVIFVVLNVVLAFAGDPGNCDAAGRTINIDPNEANSFQTKWDQFDASLDAGQAASVTLAESEVSSRARRYLEDENDTPVKDVLVCIRAGYGEASGSIDTPVGLEAKVKVRGTMDLTGDHPKATIEEIDIGGIPDFLIGPVEGWIEELIDNQLDDIDLKHGYQPTLKEGEADIKGTP